MSAVRLEHPDLPGQPITVNEQAVPHYAASGWVVAEDQEPEPRRKPALASSTATPTDHQPEPAPDKPSRRRTLKEDEK
jgi:hypothetical protein